jgi:uncharacterized coiled-coil DUF342 family protein
MENGWAKRIEELEAEVAKLTAERDADRRREYGYSQQTVDALTAERDSLKHLYDKALGDLVKDSQRISELEAENRRLRERVQMAADYQFPRRGVSPTKRNG